MFTAGIGKKIERILSHSKRMIGLVILILLSIAVLASNTNILVDASNNAVINNISDIKKDLMGSDLNPKIDEDLRKLVTSQTSDTEALVIVVLKEQPAHDVSSKIKQKYELQFQGITEPAKDIYKRVKTLSGSEEKLKGKKVPEFIALEQSILTDNETAVLDNIGKNLESKKREMRREILAGTESVVNKTQAPVIDKIMANGGNVKYSSKIFNAIVADIPVSYIEELSKDKTIYKIYSDNLYSADLDVSTQAMGANTWWGNNYTGATTDAAIVDTGIDGTHPALTVDYARVFHAAGATDPNYGDNPDSTDDIFGHGTFVASIVASTNSTYRGAGYGIDKLINAKAGWKGKQGSGYIYDSDAMQAIDWAVFGNNDDADVISFSYGGNQTDGNSEFEHFMDAIVNTLDIPVVVAAGNSGPANSSITQPAGAFNVIAVGNMDDRNTPSRNDDVLRSSSSFGPTLDGRIKPDIVAPGFDIMSASNNWEGDNPDFVTKSGTSMAAPHITGSILLILNYKNRRWQPAAVKALLLNTAEDDRWNIGPDYYYGFGYVDLSHAYIHRDDIHTGSIADFPSGRIEKFFKGPAQKNDTSTLVWDRHVSYIGSNYPVSYPNISNLDLYLYDESGGALIGSSNSTRNNVEQVRSFGNYRLKYIEDRTKWDFSCRNS